MSSDRTIRSDIRYQDFVAQMRRNPDYAALAGRRVDCSARRHSQDDVWRFAMPL
jgi:hypothetical protein